MALQKILASRYMIGQAEGWITARDADLIPPKHLGLVRSMNRTGTLLTGCCLQLNKEILTLIQSKAERTGIYCAVESSTTAHSELNKLANETAETFSKTYSQLIPPKWCLQTSISLAAFAAAIALGVEGGVHTFHHYRWGVLHALQQAQIDLENGSVDLALVVAVSTLEDPLMVQNRKRRFPGLVPHEAVGVVLLEPNSEFKLVERPLQNKHYGIAHPLIQTIASDA